MFLLTAHRSGGTLLARLLNCHPDVTIWGEHAGFINKLAELDAVLAYYPPLMQSLTERGIDGSAGSGGVEPGNFRPWHGPFERSDFRDWCRGFIQQTFRLTLKPGHRWGFKEIRYHTVLTARFLAELFPDARFVILRRGLPALALSNMLVSWSIERLRQSGATASDDGVREAVADCAYALTAIDCGLQAIARTLPERCHVITHEALSATPDAVLIRLFGFLDLHGSPELLGALRAVMRTRLGATDFAGGHGHLDRTTVERFLPEALAAAQAAIAADGPDLARLKRLSRQGRYSYLAGDHELYDTPYSTMF